MKDGFRMRTVGSIAVDSGQICVIDPCHTGEAPDVNGVVVGTNYGDGLYPVEEIWVDGEREGLFISLQGPYAEVMGKIRKKENKKNYDRIFKKKNKNNEK